MKIQKLMTTCFDKILGPSNRYDLVNISSQIPKPVIEKLERVLPELENSAFRTSCRVNVQPHISPATQKIDSTVINYGPRSIVLNNEASAKDMALKVYDHISRVETTFLNI